MKKRIVVLLLTGAMLFTGCAIERDNMMVLISGSHQDLMKIGESVCPLSYAKVFLANYQNIYGEAYGIDLWERGDEELPLDEYVKETAVSSLARIFSMNALAEESGIVSDEGDMEKATLAAKEYYDSLSKEEVEWMEIDPEGLTDLYLRYALAEKLYKSLTKDVNHEISEDEARVMTIQEIYTTDREAAETVQKALSDGTDFATLAAQYTENPQVERNIKRGILPAPVEEAAYILDSGEIADMVETENGWYFVKCINKNVEDLTAENKLVIAENREKEASDDVYEKYVSKLPSVLNEDLFQSMEPLTDGSITTDSFFSIYKKYFEQ